MPRHSRREQAAILDFALIATIEQRRHTAIFPSSKEVASLVIGGPHLDKALSNTVWGWKTETFNSQNVVM